MRKTQPDFFDQLVRIQEPQYLWIGCSDSRVPANQIVDMQPGEMFVHRNVANLCLHSDMNFLSVLEYALEVLRIEHAIVCGHYGCGGVRAALKRESHGLIDNWLASVKETRQRHREELDQIEDEEKRVNRLCELNVIEQARNLSHTPIVQRAWNEGRRFVVHSWIYDLRDGLLHDLKFDLDTPREEDQAWHLPSAGAP